MNVSISVNSKHDYKLLTVIGPKRPTMQSFIRSLEDRLGEMSHFWVSRFSDSVRRDFRLSFQNRPNSADSPVFHSIAETGNQFYKTEEAAYYYFLKILSNKGYSIGEELSKFISEFISQFPTPQPSSTPQQADLSPSNASDERTSVISFNSRNSTIDLSLLASPSWPPAESSRRIVQTIDRLVSQFDSNYLTLKNPSTALVDDLLPRLRPSIERFVYEATGRCLWMHYRQGFYEEDKSFYMKSMAIRGAHSDNLAESCGVRDVFRFGYQKSIALLDDLQFTFDNSSTIIPNVLLQRLLSILISMKTEVIVGTNAQRELESMDDIAPVFLFVLVSATGVKSPNALYNFLLDTMHSDQRMESEGRTVALLEGATRLVMNEWSTAAAPPPTIEDTSTIAYREDSNLLEF